MEATISKWGNSVGVRLPSAMAARLGLEPGGKVLVSADGDGIRLRPAPKQRRYTLDELLAGITKDNLHGEISSGPDRGKESLE